MRTDELLTLLAADTTPVRPFRRSFLLALAIGVLLSALVMLSTIGTRPDLASAIVSPRVIAKLVITWLAAGLAALVVFRSGRPGMALRGTAAWLFLPAALLVAAVAVELATLPYSLWMPSLVGRNAAFCLFFIPLLSSIPMTAFFMAMRHGAPTQPGRAGLACGLGSAAIAASLYALHCPDDSPLFVATWYMLAILIVSAVGGFAGKRLLRW